MSNKSNRRTFFSKAIKSTLAVGIGITFSDANARQPGNKVRLLTSKGKVIEMDSEIFNQKVIEKKTTNIDILDWSDQIKT